MYIPEFSHENQLLYEVNENHFLMPTLMIANHEGTADGKVYSWIKDALIISNHLQVSSL